MTICSLLLAAAPTQLHTPNCDQFSSSIPFIHDFAIFLPVPCGCCQPAIWPVEDNKTKQKCARSMSNHQHRRPEQANQLKWRQTILSPPASSFPSFLCQFLAFIFITNQPAIHPSVCPSIHSTSYSFAFARWRVGFFIVCICPMVNPLNDEQNGKWHRGE